jgi:hypothetical protein
VQILAIPLPGAESHTFILGRVTAEMVSRGHEVVVSPFPETTLAVEVSESQMGLDKVEARKGRQLWLLHFRGATDSKHALRMEGADIHLISSQDCLHEIIAFRMSHLCITSCCLCQVAVFLQTSSQQQSYRYTALFCSPIR